MTCLLHALTSHMQIKRCPWLALSVEHQTFHPRIMGLSDVLAFRFLLTFILLLYLLAAVPWPAPAPLSGGAGRVLRPTSFAHQHRQQPPHCTCAGSRAGRGSLGKGLSAHAQAGSGAGSRGGAVTAQAPPGRWESVRGSGARCTGLGWGRGTGTVSVPRSEPRRLLPCRAGAAPGTMVKQR